MLVAVVDVTIVVAVIVAVVDVVASYFRHDCWLHSLMMLLTLLMLLWSGDVMVIVG